MRVRVRGVTYESVRHAASALGVSKFSIYAALRRGSEDRLGIVSTKRKAVVLNGIPFQSYSAASVALGFNRSFVRWVMTSGSETALARLQKAVHKYKEGMK